MLKTLTLILFIIFLLPTFSYTMQPITFNKALHDTLLEMKEKDQQLRTSLLAADFNDENIKKELSAVDAEHLSQLKKIINIYGWPTKDLVGEDGTLAAWLLVQHADNDPAFQDLYVNHLFK